MYVEDYVDYVRDSVDSVEHSVWQDHDDWRAAGYSVIIIGEAQPESLVAFAETVGGELMPLVHANGHALRTKSRVVASLAQLWFGIKKCPVHMRISSFCLGRSYSCPLAECTNKKNQRRA